MTLILKSHDEVQKILATTRFQVHFLKEKKIYPHLAVILVGNDIASQIYVKKKCEQAESLGIKSSLYHLSEKTTQDQLLKCIDVLNNDSDVHGILIQLPLPDDFHTLDVLQAVCPTKDVDGLHPINLGRLISGHPYLVACTPLSCLHLIKVAKFKLEGLIVTLIGASVLIGRPLLHLLLNHGCTVRITHIQTHDMIQECATADVIVAAAGVPNLVQPSWIKPGAVVIDVGIHRTENTNDAQSRIVGDVNFEQVVNKAAAITPVPGGVGPLTVAYLMKNTLQAAAFQNNISLD